MRSFSPCADKATGDDQRCACKGRRRQRFSEYQPAHDRCPDKGGIFEWNQHLRLRPGISPGQKHERTESEQRGSADGQEKICGRNDGKRSEEHTSELQSLMRSSYAVFCLKTQKQTQKQAHIASNKHSI